MKVTISKRGLFRRTWRAWLTAPSWKKARIPTEIAIAWNIIALFLYVFVYHSYKSALFWSVMTVLLIFFNWYYYIKHIERALKELLEIQAKRDEEVNKVD